MFDLRTLGGIDLRATDDGRGLQSVLSQTKRLALLCYLAVARPRGFHSRDTLLALFWPERDADRARHALAQSLYVLRHRLGPSVVETRSDGAVGLSPDAVRCDAVELEKALERGDLERAVDRYRGELLAGLHVPGASGFERWLDDERARLRMRVVEAAGTLAERRAAAGNPAGATHWARRAVALDPYSEVRVRRLLELLAGAGDRAGALREYERFRARIAEDLGLEPRPEMLAIVDRLRTDATAEAATPIESADAVDPATASSEAAATPVVSRTVVAHPDASSEATDTASPPDRSNVRSGVSAAPPTVLLPLLVLVTAGIALIFPWGGSTEARSSGPPRVAVLPFAVEGGPHVADVGHTAADLLSVKLAMPGQLEPTAPRALPIGPSDARAAGFDSTLARATAARSGAQFYVTGNVLEAGGQFRIDAALYDTAGQRRALAVATAETEAGLFDALDGIARDLLADHFLEASSTERSVRLPTTSLAAVKAYVAGERAFHEGRFYDAMEAYRLATEADSTFGRAFYRRAVAADWAGRYEEVGPDLDRAWRLRDRLSERDRLLILGKRAATAGDAVASEEYFRAAVALDPNDVEVIYELTDLLFHQSRRGVLPEELVPGFRRVLRLQPEHPGALLHLARLAAMQDDTSTLSSVVDRGLAVGPEESLRSLELRALRAFAAGDAAEQARIVAAFRSLSDERLRALVQRTIAFTAAVESARPLAELLVERVRSRETRAVGHLTMAHLDAARGRLAAARREVRRARALDPVAGLRGRPLLAVMPEFPATSAELEAVRESLERSDAVALGDPEPGMEPYHESALRSVLLGLLSARMGDHADAERYAAELERASGRPARNAAPLVRAFSAWWRDRPDEALRLIGEEAREGPDEVADPAGLEVFLRARLLRDLGRHEEALAWYGSMVRELPFNLLYLAPSHLARAEIEEGLGRTADAARHYARFIDLWEGADPELEPVVERARRRLESLDRATRR